MLRKSRKEIVVFKLLLSDDIRLVLLVSYAYTYKNALLL